MGSSDCRIPSLNYSWIPTRQPVVLDLWKNEVRVSPRGFTSIMNWSGRKKLLFENEEWGQKDVEFDKFKAIPAQLQKSKFEVAINKPLNKESVLDFHEYENLGWKISRPPGNRAASTQTSCPGLDFLAEGRSRAFLLGETLIAATERVLPARLSGT